MYTHDEARPAEQPRYTLSWAYDDEEHPTEVTIFDSREEPTTRWVTVDEDHVRDLEDNA